MSVNEKELVVGTRGSELALVQADATELALENAFPELTVRRQVITTTGDRRTDVSLSQVAKVEGVFDKGVFIKELEIALEEGTIDIAVHSLKDVPTVLDPIFEIAAVLPRAPIRDVLVQRVEGGLKALPQGATVGTSSARRARQIQWLRPDVTVVDIRGNVPTRLRKLAEGQYDAILLAEAGLVRLGFLLEDALETPAGPVFATPLDEEVFYPAAGQGAIGLEVRVNDERARACAQAIGHAETFARVTAEREFLRLLEAGCNTPVGVYSALTGGLLELKARVFDEADPDAEPKTAIARGPVERPLEIAAKLFESLA